MKSSSGTAISKDPPPGAQHYADEFAMLTKKSGF
jgi:hypothetical protein